MANLTDNLVDLIRAYITPEIVDKAAAFLGENRGTTEKAVNTAVPALLSVFSKFAGTSAGASKLFDLIRSSDSGDILSTAASLFTNNQNTESKLNFGNSLLDTVLGNKKNGFIDNIAGAVGMKNSSVLSMLSLIGPFILGFLRKHTDSLGLNAAGLGRLLTDQSGLFTRLLPAGAASLLGFSDMASASARKADATVKEEEEVGGIWKWLLPLLLLLGTIILTVLGLKGCNDQDVQHQVNRVSRALSSISLPGGVHISVPQDGFNYKLVEFLNNPADMTVPKTFVFDDLNFYFNSTKLTPESKKTVDDLIVILKAFPTTEARLEGHTDNVGDAATNLKFSQDRANLVKQILVTGGISHSRLTTDGFGQDRPIDTNDTDAGRARNRRTELVVTKK